MPSAAAALPPRCPSDQGGAPFLRRPVAV